MSEIQSSSSGLPAPKIKDTGEKFIRYAPEKGKPRGFTYPSGRTIPITLLINPPGIKN